MDWKEALERIFNTIFEVARLQGLRSINELEDKLCTYRGFFRKARFRERLEFGKLMRILSVLEVEPYEFFQRAFHDHWPVADAVRDFGYLSVPFLYKFPHGSELADLASQPSEPIITSESIINSQMTVDLKNLKKADQLKFSNPKRARAQARKSYQQAVADRNLLLAVSAAGVWSSSLRLSSQSGPSQALLCRALKIAKESANCTEWRSLFADLLRRASYIADDQSKYSLGIDLTDRAIQLCALGGDPSGVGRSLTVRGTAASRMGDRKESISSSQAALLFLSVHDDDDRDYRLTALFNLAFEESQSENYSTAARYLDRVEELKIESTGLHFLGRVEWLRSRVLKGLKEASKAQKHYGNAFSLLKKFPIDASVISVEGLSLSIQSGNKRMEEKWLTRFLRSSFKVKYSPILDGAIEEVLRTFDSPDLKGEIIDEVRKELERRQGLTAL